MAFTPVEMVRRNRIEIAETPAQYAQMLWDGYVPTGSPAGRDIFDEQMVARLSGDTAFQAALRAAFETVRRGTSLTAIGDSITAPSGSGTSTTWHALACAKSMGQFTYVRPAAVPGYNSTQAAETLLPQVLAMSPTPDYCAVLIGTNDAGAAWLSNIATIFAALQAAGIKPIACTLPPLDSSPGAPVAKNATLAAFCERNRLPLVDFYSALASAADGHWKAGLSGDGVHPSIAGSQVMARAFAESGVVDDGRPWAPYLTGSAADDTNLIGGGGSFVTGSGGIGAGWIAGGDGVGVAYSLVPDPTIAGQWQRITRTGGTTLAQLSREITSGFAPGDRLAVSALVRTRNVQANAVGCYLGLTFSGAANSDPPEPKLLYNWQADMNLALVSQEATVPAGTTAIPVRIQMAQGVGIFDVAQFTVTNLTALGVS